MTESLLQFVRLRSQMPSKRPASLRIRDFAEIHADFDVQAAASQASRCSQCGVPFCQVHCPLTNAIPDWLALAAQGRVQEAWALSQSTNNFPEICGRICPQDRLCEGRCVLEQSGHGTVTIGAIERHLSETAWQNGWIEPVRPGKARGRSVGIIGAGPAGLAAAEQLRTLGYDVAVYDRHDRAGGLLVYGIPAFKLDKAVVARRTDRLAEGGIRFHQGVEVGRDVSLTELRHRHGALLIATGVYRARTLLAPGVGLGGIEPALEYLIAANRIGLGDRVPAFEDGRLNAHGRRVVVIGGGDTAMDCVRTAVRQGAASVTCMYRRDRVNMPGSQREVMHAEEEGVHFAWLAAPAAFLGETHVTAVRAQRMRLSAPDASGRQGPVVVPGADFTEPADLVLNALGFDAEDLPMAFAEPDLRTTSEGTLATQGLRTSLPGIFAAGDIVRGASLVVWAIRDGRDAAVQVHAWLQDGGAW
jgi:glutamate synthase (NADPH/NADH) small chain